MFSISQRFQTVSNEALSFSFLLIGFVIAASWYQLYQDNAFFTPATINALSANMNMRTSRFYGSNKGRSKENTKVSFDLDADLAPLFNWNTKQVFAYLTAEYDGELNSNTKNVVTFWDKIIGSKENAHLQLENAKSKYTVWDLEDKFSGRELTFKLKWNIQPWIGPLVYGETEGKSIFTLPEKKINESAKEEKKAESDDSSSEKKTKKKRRVRKQRASTEAK